MTGLNPLFWGQTPPKINGLLGLALVLQPRAAVQKQDHLKHLREELSSSFAKERAEWHLFFMIRFAGSRIIILGTQGLPAVGTVCFVLFYFFLEVAIGLQEAKGQSDAITQLARKQELSTDSLQVP